MRRQKQPFHPKGRSYRGGSSRCEGLDRCRTTELLHGGTNQHRIAHSGRKKNSPRPSFVVILHEKQNKKAEFEILFFTSQMTRDVCLPQSTESPTSYTTTRHYKIRQRGGIPTCQHPSELPMARAFLHECFGRPSAAATLIKQWQRKRHCR